MSGTLYVVLAIDAEGPVTDPRHDDLLNDWEAIDRNLATLFSDEFRSKVADTRGRPLVMSWFVLYWTGFRTNPVKRDLGYHKVLDHYRDVWGTAMDRFGDGVYWHYHHPPRSGIGNEWNTDWLDNEEYNNILSRMILDRGYFPSVFRAGGTIETAETSRWLEQWIPFDYSNRAGKLNLNKREPDGRWLSELFDWSHAPDDWSHYHPDSGDYQKPGTMKRTMFRSVDLKSVVYVLGQDEIEKAFERAAGGTDTVFSCWEHDFRDRSQAISTLLLDGLKNVARKFPSVSWRYANALEAAQAVTGQSEGSIPVFSVRLEDNLLLVTSDRPLFGPRPFVALREGECYRHCRVEMAGEREWRYPLDGAASGLLIGVAGAGDAGRVGLARYRIEGGCLKKA